MAMESFIGRIAANTLSREKRGGSSAVHEPCVQVNFRKLNVKTYGPTGSVRPLTSLRKQKHNVEEREEWGAGSGIRHIKKKKACALILPWNLKLLIPLKQKMKQCFQRLGRAEEGRHKPAAGQRPQSGQSGGRSSSVP